MGKLNSILADECGQGMVEYGLIVGLIAAVVAIILMTMSSRLTGVYSNLNNQIP